MVSERTGTSSVDRVAMLIGITQASREGLKNQSVVRMNSGSLTQLLLVNDDAASPRVPWLLGLLA